jgi:phospholipid/cholesterol/gamma-HCH transport system substrate-binding protein
MTRLRTILIAVLCAAVAATLGGCSVLGSGGGSQHMTAYFARATAFYEQSHVKIMGVDVGTVDKITVQGDKVRVDFSIDAGVPVPDNVQASIVPLNLVGERNLILHPAWQPGMGKAGNGTVIPEERTTLPVETDDALKSFTNVANALDPSKVHDALGKAANAFRGNGNAFNEALQHTANITTTLASQDQELLAVAQNLNRLAGAVRGREQVIGSMIRDFSTATKIFGDERVQIQSLIDNALILLQDGGSLIKKYQGNLPYDLAELTRVTLILKNDAPQLGQLISALPGINKAFAGGWDPSRHALVLRFATDAFLRTWIQALTGKDGTKCPLPAPNSNCPWMTGSKK